MRPFVALTALSFLCLGQATIHDLKDHKDDRNLFKIETFCFDVGGFMNITLQDFEIPHTSNEDVQAGFMMIRTESESEMQQILEESNEDGSCLLDDTELDTALKIDLSRDKSNNVKEMNKQWKLTIQTAKITPGQEGLYSLVFARCEPPGNIEVSFDLYATFYNPGPNYLSACEKALPMLFLTFTLAFAAALGAWVWLLLKRKSNVHNIHWLMAVLLVVKILALLFDSVRYHFIALTGSGEMWAVVYYVFAFLKGLLLFTVILLIGTGWSLLKPFLSDREKKIIFVVLILQVLDNIALVVLEEMAPGSQQWYTWRDVLHLVDIICCCAILFPIVWSIRHLREAAAVDGKAGHNLAKLTLFRQFYIMVIAYIYFTRIIVFLLAATMPYNLMWLRFLFSELATFAFYVVTGFKFQPAEDNPYLPVSKEDPDESLSEFGLEDSDDDGIRMSRVKTSSD